MAKRNKFIIDFFHVFNGVNLGYYFFDYFSFFDGIITSQRLVDHVQQVEILLDEYMHEIYGENAQFREGQREAILSVLEGKRTLVVQRTGWGKSLVYFLASKVLRSLGYGPTIVISPLLSLMRNQVKSAEKHGLVAEIITSENHDVHDHIAGLLSEGAIDVLFISPERLGNDKFLSEILPNIHNGHRFACRGRSALHF